MREIKFRAWDVDAMAMEYIDLYWFEENSIRTIPDAGNVVGYCHNIIMQYTGLEDKNGKEIYEGDILKTSVGALPSIGVVKFMVDADWPGFYIESREWKSSFPGEREVIGNIYENPELMKGAKHGQGG